MPYIVMILYFDGCTLLVMEVQPVLYYFNLSGLMIQIIQVYAILFYMLYVWSYNTHYTCIHYVLIYDIGLVLYYPLYMYTIRPFKCYSL